MWRGMWRRIDSSRHGWKIDPGSYISLFMKRRRKREVGGKRNPWPLEMERGQN